MARMSEPLASGLSLREVSDQWGREDCETWKMGCLCCDFSVRRVWPGRLLGEGEVPAGSQRTGEEEELATSRWREEHEQRWRGKKPSWKEDGISCISGPSLVACQKHHGHPSFNKQPLLNAHMGPNSHTLN